MSLIPGDSIPITSGWQYADRQALLDMKGMLNQLVIELNDMQDAFADGTYRTELMELLTSLDERLGRTNGTYIYGTNTRLNTTNNHLAALTEDLELLTDNLGSMMELQTAIYAAILFIIGTVAAVGVIYLLYKFLRKFF